MFLTIRKTSTLNSLQLYNSQTLETNQMFINIKKVNLVSYIYSMEHCGTEKELTTNKCNNIDGSYWSTIDWKKSDSKEHIKEYIWWASIYMMFQNRQNSSEVTEVRIVAIHKELLTDRGA